MCSIHHVLPSSIIASMEDCMTAYIMMFASTAAMGFAVSTVLSKLHLPYIWRHKVTPLLFRESDHKPCSYPVDYYVYII